MHELYNIIYKHGFVYNNIKSTYGVMEYFDMSSMEIKNNRNGTITIKDNGAVVKTLYYFESTYENLDSFLYDYTRKKKLTSLLNEI